MDAWRFVKAGASPRFIESVMLDIQLNIDAKRSDERVRGTVVLPHSTGKTVRVAVFARGPLADEAVAAGADLVGGEELVAEVLKGNIDFQRCFATPDMMPLLARAARILGPKGLMPNPKRGTVVTEVTDVVKRAKRGELVFKAQKQGVVSNMIGKMDFAPDVLCENALAYLTAVLAARPSRFRSKPPLSIVLSSTMGPGVKLDHRMWAEERRR